MHQPVSEHASQHVRYGDLVCYFAVGKPELVDEPVHDVRFLFLVGFAGDSNCSIISGSSQLSIVSNA